MRAKQGSSLKRALASCRRVFLGTLVSILLLAGGLYWQSPSLETIKPSIEQYLQEKLQLKSLKLGQLSWRWTGLLWLQVDHLDFSSADQSIAFHHGRAAVRVPLRIFFQDDIAPDLIRLEHGTLTLNLDGTLAPVLPEQMMLKDVNLDWHYRGWHGYLPSVQLALHGTERSLTAATPSLQVHAQLDKDGLPHKFTLTCQHTDWLPDPLVKQLNGDPQAQLTVLRLDTSHWNLAFNIDSSQPATIIPSSVYRLQLNHLDANLDIALAAGNSRLPEQVEIHSMHWALGENEASAHGRWQQGVLDLHGQAHQLAMPIIWSWLKPLGEQQWHDWLSRMQTGVAKQSKVELSLAWADPMHGWPSPDEIAAAKYQLQTHVEDADIALGISPDKLQHSNIDVRLDQRGLHAEILDTELPRGIGHANGKLVIPWASLNLSIEGRANTDVAKLLHWFDAKEIDGLIWNHARANSEFKLLWNPGQPAPKQASASLHPDGQWDVSIMKFPLHLSAGTIQWDQQDGLKLADMHIENDYLHSRLSLQSHQLGDRWKITALKASGKAKLAMLAAHFQLPLAHPAGEVSTTLRFDKQWSGSIDLKHASWEHLLGSDKKNGEALSIQYQGKLDMDAKLPTIHLDHIVSKGAKIMLHEGAASINRDHLTARLSGLHTPAFSGALNINLPFNAHQPWLMDVNASYLNRNALPDSIEQPEQAMDRQWLLTANIDQFDWDAARMSGVHIKLSSDMHQIGILEAAQIHTAQMDIMDVDARFTLPGQGTVDLRRFSASLEKQQLTMSATLSPEPEGGMRWRGFATLSGDFGHLMQVSGLSKRFIEGKEHILFSGQGVILRDQPWWQGLDGRMRMRVDQGRVREGGSMSTLLAAIDLSKLPALLIGQRKDLSGPGLLYQRLQMEAIMQDQNIHIRNIIMRSTAFDLIGHGNMDIDQDSIDMYLIANPLQNIDALLAKIPLLRDLLGGQSHSLMRKVYHMYGPFNDAKVEAVKPEAAGLASPGLIENLFSLPNRWFGSGEKKPKEK